MKLRYVWVGVVVLMAASCLAVSADEHEGHKGTEPGFKRIFNGKDLSGWDGDPRLWSVKDGVIHGETTKENPANGNTFLIWRGGKVRDFILKIKFRIQNGNSGIQYRSKEVKKWRVSGYQAEVENNPGKVGFLYHEAGRGWLVDVGDFMVIDDEGKKNVVSKVSDVDHLKEAGYYNMKGWNEYTIIARGNYLQHYLNGYPTMSLIDNDRVTDPDDPKDRKGAAREGLLALQIHAGPPMVVEFKDIRLKQLDANYGDAFRLFNGKNMDGWTVSSDALKDTFDVKNGVLTDSGRPAGYVRTVKDYTNYALHLQLKHVKPGNSGVLLRKTGPDKVWPRSIEAQGMSGNMGDIWNIGNVPMKTDPDRTHGRRTVKMHPSNERPIGQWNDYDITLDGGRLEIRVNNLLQNAATECQEIPGKICLQSEGSPKEFRNIVMMPIKTDSGFKPVDFSEWETEGNWKVTENGVALHPRPQDEGWKRFEDYIWAPKKYGDFAIDLEFKIREGGNSGVFFRVGDKSNAVETGLEAQILDTHGKKNPGPHDCGGIIGTVGPTKNMAKPAGEWNHMRVRCEGSHLQLHLNGEKVVDIDLDDTDHGDRPPVGYVGFQDEAKHVEYRNVRIKEL